MVPQSRIAMYYNNQTPSLSPTLCKRPPSPIELKHATQVLLYSSQTLGVRQWNDGQILTGAGSSQHSGIQSLRELATSTQNNHSHAKIRPIHSKPSLYSLCENEDKCEPIRGIFGIPSLKENVDHQKDGTLSKLSIDNATWKHIPQTLCPTMYWYLHVLV